MIKLFYPASFLPHKNHIMLSHPLVSEYLASHDLRIYLTIAESDMLFYSSDIVLLGRISYELCMDYLESSSALLFLSSFESLGLPLIEASQLNKPCICPDLPYARELLGDSPYFYSDMSVKSLILTVDSFVNKYHSPRPSVLRSSPVPIECAWNQFIALSCTD